jgi:hypothetical protein
MSSARAALLGVCLAMVGTPLAHARRKADATQVQSSQRGPLGRVLSETAQVYSGAGFSYRVIATVRRDDTVRMIERGKRGGWTRVQIESGIVGWILSEQILLLSEATGDEPEPSRMRRFGRKLREKVLGPANLLTARAGGTLSAGALGREGLFLVRPQVFISPNAAIEGFVGPSAGRETSRGIMGLSTNLYLSPGIPFTVFVSVGGGAVFTKGKADSLRSARWSYLASPGGGLWIIFKRSVGIRFDFRNHILFRADDAQSLQEYSGALAFTF